MVALNLQNAYESDSKAVKFLIRSTIHSAMNPSNTNYNITSIKLDFSRGKLHVGDDDPRYVYRSPVMTIETIPIGPSYDREIDVSNQFKMLEDETRKLSGSENGSGKTSFETNPSVLNAMADGTPSEYDIYQAYLETNDLSEAECPFIFDQNDANHISQKDDVMCVEDGDEKATTSVPQKSTSEITSMNSFSNLKTVSSIISGKSDYVIREIADELNDADADDGKQHITSYISSDETQSDDSFDVQIIDESHQIGTRQIFERINNEICDELKNLFSDSIFNILFL